MDLQHIHRINVVGTTGSGKSTFSKRLSKALGYTYFCMDELYWKPNWGEPTDAEYFRILEEALSKDSWILDGNYGRTTHIKWQRVQMVIWLDLSLRLNLYRSVKRSLNRAITGKELWPGTGNVETFGRMLGKNSIIRWMLKTHPTNQARYQKAMSDPRYAHIQFVRLSSPREVEAFLQKIEQAKR